MVYIQVLLRVLIKTLKSVLAFMHKWSLCLKSTMGEAVRAFSISTVLSYPAFSLPQIHLLCFKKRKNLCLAQLHPSFAASLPLHSLCCCNTRRPVASLSGQMSHQGEVVCDHWNEASQQLARSGSFAHFLEVNRNFGALASCKPSSRSHARCTLLAWVSLRQHLGSPSAAISVHAPRFLGQIAHVSGTHDAEASWPLGKAPVAHVLHVAVKFDCMSAIPSHVSSFPAPCCYAQGGRGCLGSQCEIKIMIVGLHPTKQHQT